VSFWANYGERPLAIRASVALAVTLAFLAVPAVADHWAYLHLSHAHLYDLDWARLLRLMGWWPTWVLLALTLWLHERGSTTTGPAANHRALLVAGSPAVAGVLCEVLKLLIRRERPDTGAGEWLFRAWDDRTFSTAGLATPSSHTMVAFGGATMAARLFPRARWVFHALAWGCAATRVLSHAHYLSDVTFGAVLGWAVGWALWLEWGRGMKTATAGSIPTVGA
jgi:membrane-associated phospholipid phosphatase